MMSSRPYPVETTTLYRLETLADSTGKLPVDLRVGTTPQLPGSFTTPPRRPCRDTPGRRRYKALSQDPLCLVAHDRGAASSEDVKTEARRAVDLPFIGTRLTYLYERSLRVPVRLVGLILVAEDDPLSVRDSTILLCSKRTDPRA